MAKNQRTYDHENKVQAVKLAQKIVSAAAAREPGISSNTVYTWIKRVFHIVGQYSFGDSAKILKCIKHTTL